jgi:hypothetical protein
MRGQMAVTKPRNRNKQWSRNRNEMQKKIKSSENPEPE